MTREFSASPSEASSQNILHSDGSSLISAHRIHLVCRDGEHFGALLYGSGPASRPPALDSTPDPPDLTVLGEPEASPVEQRVHRMAVVEALLTGKIVTVGPLDMNVFYYLTAVEAGSLSPRLEQLPWEAPADVSLPLIARGRYQVIGVVRQQGRRSPMTGLVLQSLTTQGASGQVSLPTLVARMVSPPGLTLTVAQGDGSLLPVVLRLTSHAENVRENDLITLPGCKGKWGKLAEL